MVLNKDLLMKAMGCSDALAEKWLGPMNGVMDSFDINTPARAAAFIAQVGHESGDFTVARENMNYSADRLLQVFPKRFTPALAEKYAHNPTAIASKVYADRMGNGDEASGDGWKFRGGGLIQLTGREAYAAFGKSVSAPLEADPDMINEPRWAALSAGWEWRLHNCNKFADLGDIDGVSDVINIGHKTIMDGDSIGFKDRMARWHRALEAFQA